MKDKRTNYLCFFVLHEKYLVMSNKVYIEPIKKHMMRLMLKEEIK